MDSTDRVGGVLLESRLNALLSWIVVVFLVGFGIERLFAGDLRTTLLVTLLLIVAFVPPVMYRTPGIMPPWDLLVLASLPVVWEGIGGDPFQTDVVAYIAVAIVCLLIAVELHAFTPVRMNHTFVILLVPLSTMAVAAMYNIGLYLSDVLFGTAFLLDGRHPDVINAVVMLELAYAVVAGILAGIAFVFFFRKRVRPASERTYVPVREARIERGHETDTPTLGERLKLSNTTQRRLTRAMQLVLVGILLGGIYTVHLPTIANAGVALVITFLPGLLERDLQLPMDSGLVLWITTAVFLHALGSAGLYDVIARWDNLTHVLSASVVAAVGYSLFRAIHLHSRYVNLPPAFIFGLVIVFVLAAGVLWEVLEFAIDQFALYAGIPAVLAQFGIHDTMVDLIFNLVGALITATFATIYLTDLTESLADRLTEWAAE